MDRENVKTKYHKYMKARFNSCRISGLLMCFLMVGLFLMQYFQIISPKWNAVSLMYLCGFLFTINSQYQDLRQNKGWARACRIIAALLYIFTVFVLVVLVLDTYWGITF